MPRCFYNVKNGQVDPAGLNCHDDQDATAKAIVITQQIARDAPATSGGRVVSVLNSERHEIGKVPVTPTATTRRRELERVGKAGVDG